MKLTTGTVTVASRIVVGMMAAVTAIASAHRSEARRQISDLEGAEDDLKRFSCLWNECDRSSNQAPQSE